MKKTLLSCFLLLLMSVTANAQIVKGDMNDDKTVDINDVVSSVNVVLGNQPMEVITASDILDPYMVDNSKVIGTWYKSKTETITFNADYTTDYSDAVGYRYQPYLGRILLYNSDGLPYRKVDVSFAPADTLFLDFVVYTKAKPVYKVTSITLSETSLTLKVGNTQQLTATVSPTDADDSSVTWTSSDESVATVIDGLITAIAPGTATITCSSTDGGASTTCTVTVPEPVKVSSITLSETSIVLEPDATKRLTATILPADADDNSVSWSSSDESIATVINGLVVAISEGTATITCSANDGSGVIASCTVKVNIDSSGIIDGREYVDLGLTSGTLWATTNIGADSPEDYGDYFAWGETEGYNSGKTTFDWSTYKWCNGDSYKITKYCTISYYGNGGFTDGKAVLDANDDAARANWGGDWRMPTRAEFEELINNTKNEWTTQNNVAGYKFTSKTNGNSIFLPAAGFRWNGYLDYTGSNGNYWSSTLYDESPGNAWCLYFLSGSVGTGKGVRNGGLPVRPVR